MKIYFMGICGTAMGNAALLARAAGHEVLGADTGVYPPMSTVLAQAGITLHEGYDATRLYDISQYDVRDRQFRLGVKYAM